MRLAIAANGQTLDGDVSSRFGRAASFIIVEPADTIIEAFVNPAAAMPGGAGPAAVQELVNRNVEVVLAGEFGPKAQQALTTAGIRGVPTSGPIRDAIANFQ